MEEEINKDKKKTVRSVITLNSLIIGFWSTSKNTQKPCESGLGYFVLYTTQDTAFCEKSESSTSSEPLSE